MLLSIGAVYTYSYSSSWSYISILIASDAAASDYFGSSVAIYDQYAFVGASNSDTAQTNGGNHI